MILKSFPSLFLDRPFGLACVEVMLNSARSSGIGFIGWPHTLSTQHFICSVCALRAYPKILFV